MSGRTLGGGEDHDGRGDGYEQLIEALHQVSRDLADQALRLLRAAARADDEEARAALVAEEKRVSRARRSVEKATHLLRGRDDVF